MSKTIALRTVLTERLRTCCPRVWYGQAKDTTQRPYLVYTVEQLSYGDGQHLMELEVNVVDYGDDTAPAEELSDAVESAFDQWHYLDETIQISTYNDRKQPVEEEDRQIIRRRLLIELHVYERRND